MRVSGRESTRRKGGIRVRPKGCAPVPLSVLGAAFRSVRSQIGKVSRLGIGL